MDYQQLLTIQSITRLDEFRTLLIRCDNDRVYYYWYTDKLSVLDQYMLTRQPGDQILANTMVQVEGHSLINYPKRRVFEPVLPRDYNQ
jgi:hypothetical protein